MYGIVYSKVWCLNSKYGVLELYISKCGVLELYISKYGVSDFKVDVDYYMLQVSSSSIR